MSPLDDTQPGAMVAVDPLLGTVVAGRYRVERLLGEGAMGSVYEVSHLNLKRRFALKKLAPELSAHPESLARFRQEADVIASLNHPSVVQVTDWEQLPDGSPCLIMELLEGEDLCTRIERDAALPWPMIARIADEVISGLAVAHRAGIVHRDLKPANIFLAVDTTGSERAKLLDFGVSKIMSTEGERFTTNRGERLIGTPAYMSPEQADGKTDVGAAADVWAMGAILYEMATGHVPFVADTTMSMLYRICHGEPEPVQPLRPDAPAGFVDAIGRAMSRGPNRITTADDLRTAVARGLAAGAAPAPVPEPVPVPVPGFQANDVGKPRWPWLALAAFVVLAIAASIGIWWSRRGSGAESVVGAAADAGAVTEPGPGTGTGSGTISEVDAGVTVTAPAKTRSKPKSRPKSKSNKPPPPLSP